MSKQVNALPKEKLVDIKRRQQAKMWEFVEVAGITADVDQSNLQDKVIAIFLNIEYSFDKKLCRRIGK